MDVREKLVEQKIKGDGESICYKCFHNKVCKAMDNQPCIECNQFVDAHGVTVQEWISVKDRLPENDVMVIGYTPCDGFMFVGYYHEEPKYDWKVWRIITAMRSTKVMKKKVTHWLPLPQPPKGE